MRLILNPYLVQAALWPTTGRHILAQYDDEGVIVYQAYRPSIGHFAAAHGYFGGQDFSFERMSWIKPNFLWMMYRCGWGSKEGQEVVLAARLRRSAFDALLASAVPSTHAPALYPDAAKWKRAMQASSVRVQWDPDHDPAGRPLERRAIQLGLRGDALRRYAREWLLDIEDISAFVREQRQHFLAGNLAMLLTPRERVYPVADAAVAVRLDITA
jgi:hypothetical protein